VGKASPAWDAAEAGKPAALVYNAAVIIKINPASEPRSDAAGKLSTSKDSSLKGVVLTKESEDGSSDIGDASTSKEVVS
jgi:hypothetical protein